MQSRMDTVAIHSNFSDFENRGHAAACLQVCTNMSCQAKMSMALIHNRSVFNDKQIIRLQEAPEHIPEGETPQTVRCACFRRCLA